MLSSIIMIAMDIIVNIPHTSFVLKPGNINITCMPGKARKENKEF